MRRGNVDEQAPLDTYPVSRLLTVAGWRILIIHIVGMPPKGVCCLLAC